MTAATAMPTPTSVWVRRRAAPARRRIDGRGQVELSVCSRSGSNSGRMLVVATSRCTANCAVAVCSTRSASARGSPTSRARSLMLTLARWVSSSALRWVTGSLRERVEGGLRLRVQALVAVPEARGVPSLRVRPGVRAGPALGVGQPRDLAARGARRRRTCRGPRCGRPGGRRSARTSGAAAGTGSPCRTRRTRTAGSCGVPAEGAGGGADGALSGTGDHGPSTVREAP